MSFFTRTTLLTASIGFALSGAAVSAQTTGVDAGSNRADKTIGTGQQGTTKSSPSTSSVPAGTNIGAVGHSSGGNAVDNKGPVGNSHNGP